MKRSIVNWSTVVLMVPLAVAGVSCVCGWRPNFDPSIQISDRFGKVENGSAYDRVILDLGPRKKLVLPDNAVVRRAGEPGKGQLFMKKTLGFCGYPPKPMSIRDSRHNMGCAVKLEGDALVVATYGEWDCVEGGAEMRLVAVVPEGVDVEQRKGLSGADSAGWIGTYLTKPRDTSGYWNGPASPADEWTALPGEPDPDRKAE